MKVIVEVDVPNRRCEFCGEEFSPKRQSSRYCTRKCGKRAEYKRNAEKYNAKSQQWYKDNVERAKARRKAKYWSAPEFYRAATRSWNKLHPEHKRATDNSYKDKVRHGNKRAELIARSGLVCSRCGKVGTRFSIVAHHVTHDNQDHSEQVLLCRACHAREHKHC